MIELTPKQFHLAAPLFNQTSYGALAAGTLECTHPGRVFVDDPSSAQAGLVCTRAGIGYYFLAGTPSPVFGKALEQTFREDFLPAQQSAANNHELLLFYDRPAWHSSLVESFAGFRMLSIHKKRMVLSLDSLRSLRGWQNQLPLEVRVAPYSEDLFAAYPQVAVEPSFFYGSQQAFLRHGLGICLIDEDSGKIASTCFSVFRGAGELEISIATESAYRRRGFGFFAAAAFIAACLTRELAPVWGCWPENLPSIHLARRLGFVEQVDQPVLLCISK